MNKHLVQMVETQDRNRRASLAYQVQAQIDRAARVHLQLIERQRVIVEALIAAGIETIPAGEDVLIVADMMKDGSFVLSECSTGGVDKNV